MLPKASRGALIVFEGCDRCGKSTQSKLLADFLKSRGIPVTQEAFPERKTQTGQLIDAYLTNKSDMPNEVIHLLFSINRWEQQAKMAATLNAGTTLIVDRYSYSGVAYTAAKGLDLNWCKAPDSGLIRPDVVFYLKSDADALAARANFGDERYERKEFQAKVSSVFDTIYEAERDYWKLIDASKDVNSLHKQIASDTLELLESVKDSDLKLLNWKKS